MALSAELQASADEIRRNKSLVKSLQAERDLWKSKALDSQGKLDEMSRKDEMSDEDRAELKRQRDELDALNDELEGAAQDNTKPIQSDGSQAASDTTAAQNAQQIAEDRGKEKEAGPQPVEPIQAPLMPTLAFDPTGGNAAPAGDGQPAQAQVIETEGGFVISGGASTQRAPGSSPDSPSSSLTVSDGSAPVDEAPPVLKGIPTEPTDAEREAAQKKADIVAEEMARREANPLNLSPEDMAKRDAELAGRPVPETGSPATDKAADGGEKRGE